MIARAELLALTPDKYLSGGYRDTAGRAWPQLTKLWAIAAAEQLRASGETAIALDPLVAEITTTALRTLEPSNANGGSPAAKALVQSCADAVKLEADRAVFAEHLAAVLRLLALAESTQTFNAQQLQTAVVR